MTPLARLIADDIRANGAMALSRFMELCLTHGEHGYYMHRDPFGTAGDFITAPEISQMFGELIGLWCADLWQRAGTPDSFALVELGPGRGTLMADIMRATRGITGFHAAARCCLLETSPALRERQARALPDAAWIDHWDALPADCPAIVLANEFLDALPIDQFDATGRQRAVTLDGNRLAWTFPDAAVTGQDSAAAAACVTAIARHLGRTGGALLVVDYGVEAIRHDTLQALAGHRAVNPLDAPGDADLTAHVDFAAVRTAAAGAGCAVFGPAAQGSFLRRLGIDLRTDRLVRRNPDRAEDLYRANRRLTHPDEMGLLFKVMAIVEASWPEPAGLS